SGDAQGGRIASVDFEAEGLLDGLDDEGARSARRVLLERLHGDGVPLEELRGAVAEDRLALVPVERVLGGETRYSAHDLAKRAGVSLELLMRERQALGLPRPDPDEKVFGDEDVEAAERIRQFLDA